VTDLPPTTATGPRRKVVIVVVLLILVAYLLSIPGVWSVHSDSAIYLGLGRSLARGDGYTFNCAPFGKYPPIYPLMLSAVYGTMGWNVWAIQAMGALCGVAAAFVTYLVVKGREGGIPALAVAALTATCAWFWSHSCVYVLSGIPHTLIALVALWLAERAIRAGGFSVRRWLGVAAVGIAAVATHMSAAALAPAIAAGALLARGQTRSRRQRLTAAGIVFVLCTAAAVGWMAYGKLVAVGTNYDNLTSSEPMDMLEDPFPKLRNRASEWAATPLGMDSDDLPWSVGLALLAVFVAPGLVWGFRRHRSCAEFYVCTHFLIMFVHGGMGGKERYVLAVLPLLFYYGYLSVKLHGVWLVRVLGLAREGRERRRQQLARAGMALCFLGLVLPALYNHKRGRGGSEAFSDSKQQMKLRRRAEWEEAAQAMEDHGVPKDAVVQAGPRGDWATLHFFCDRKVGKLHPRERGMQIVRRMVDCGATYALPHKHESTRLGIMVVIKTYRQCFERLHVTKDGRLRLYRVDAEGMKALYRKWEDSGDPDPLQTGDHPEVWEDDGLE